MSDLFVCLHEESMEPVRPIGDNEVRIFVALFPYDPVNMSPNPDAAEEELPFREGQIIKVWPQLVKIIVLPAGIVISLAPCFTHSLI